MRIDVTQEDIVKGAPEDCGRCPIALAIRRATGWERVNVDYTTVQPDRDNLQDLIDLPAEAVEFISLFDKGQCAVAPFSFELEGA